ncbi:ABC transporter ATP-binding protein (plasmid) [Haloimpatiens sp. FM7330]|uniref:ABC transporter ATP-binding protein n=1 Tax=Haloimpatiens sp. FM7330 TaxID=3298610 RepID=UPI00363CF13B
MDNKFTMKSFFKILKLCKEFWKKYILISICLVITSFLSTYPIKYIEKIINTCTSVGNNKMDLFIKFGVIYLILQILNVLFRAIFEYLSADLESSIGHKIRVMLFSRLEKVPFKFYEKNNTSDLIMRLVQDSNITVDGILQPITFIINNILTFILGFIYMFSIDKTLTLIMIPMGLIISLLTLKTGTKLCILSENERQATSVLWNKFIECINGIKEIKTNCQEKRILDIITKQSNNTKTNIMNLKKYTIKTSNINSAFFMTIIAIIMILGGYKVTIGKLSIGGLSAIMMYNGLLVDPMINFFDLYQRMQRVFVSCDKIFAILECKEEENNYKYSNVKFENKIEVKNLSFKYDLSSDSKYNLNNVSLEIKKGDKIALVGYSGSGKSTLCKLLMKFYDKFEGMITIDNIDLKEMDINNIRSLFGIVFQDTFLFSGTLKENLIFGKPNASDKEIKRALEISGVDLFSKNLPDGLQTLVGENGFNLSGGEKQRISICRTILRNPDIIILDESTSALDAITTSTVTKNLINFFKDKTIIFTAHKLTNISNICNKIYVFDKGFLVEQGQHKELIGKDSLYKHLYNAQFIQ